MSITHQKVIISCDRCNKEIGFSTVASNLIKSYE